ncbi:hypothetical protein LC55x_1412 [Lysobacter capsici]|nr:hypothetical protein LC55x_1412 [Lysobacter capsici]
MAEGLIRVRPWAVEFARQRGVSVAGVIDAVSWSRLAPLLQGLA